MWTSVISTNGCKYTQCDLQNALVKNRFGLTNLFLLESQLATKARDLRQAVNLAKWASLHFDHQIFHPTGWLDIY